MNHEIWPVMKYCDDDENTEWSGEVRIVTTIKLLEAIDDG